MAAESRADMILEAATDFFAEHGFEAQIKDLASRIGVSEALVFFHFGTKQKLIEMVYQRVFLDRWSREWEPVLRDRSQSLQHRLETFYRSYLSAVDDPRWVRVSLYAGLAGHDIIQRYISNHVSHLLETIMHELRADRRLPAVAAGLDDIELAWHLHSTFIYFLIRKHIHRIPVTQDTATMVSRVVRSFLGGLRRGPARARAKAE